MSGLNRVHGKVRKSNAGAKQIDVVLVRCWCCNNCKIFPMIVSNIKIRDDFPSCVCWLELEDRVPDAKTVWVFSERLKELAWREVLFARFRETSRQYDFSR